METIIKDLCYRELQLATEACEGYIPLTAMQYYIEAEEDPKVAEIKSNNENVKKSAFDHIKKAVEAIRMAIGNLLRRLADAFSKASMDKQTKEAYEAYQAAVKEHPELANKKVTATDFKDSEKVYKKILAETEEAEKKIVAGEHVNVSDVINRCEGYLKNLGAGVATAVTAQTLLNVARSNQTAAKLISMGLNADASVMAGIENQLGKQNAEDLNNEVAKLTNRCALYRFRLKVHKRYFDDVGTCFTEAIKGLKDAAIPSTKVGDKIRKATSGNAKETDKLLRGNETAARTLNARDEALKTGAREVLKDKASAPIRNAKAKAAMNAEARREAKGDFSGADIHTYVKHNIDKLKGNK